jgi:hypothetical protein
MKNKFLFELRFWNISFLSKNLSFYSLNVSKSTWSLVSGIWRCASNDAKIEQTPQIKGADKLHTVFKYKRKMMTNKNNWNLFKIYMLTSNATCEATQPAI